MRTSVQTLLTFLYKIALSLISFCVSVLAARWFGPTDAGVANRAVFQLASTYAQTGMTFVGGFTSYHAYAVTKWPEERVRVVQTGNLLVYMMAALVWAVAATLSVAHVPIHPAWLWTLWVTPLLFIFGFGSKILNALDEISWVNRLNMVQPLLFLVFLGLCWLHRPAAADQRLTIALGLWLVTCAVAAMWTMGVTYRHLPRPARHWRWWPRHGRETWVYGGGSALAQVASYVNYRMDFWLTAWMLGNVVASVYGIAVVASEVLLNLSGSLQQVVYARMTGGAHEDAASLTEVATRQTLLSSTLAAVAMAVVFPFLIRYAYGYRYAAAVFPFWILLPGLVFKAASNLVIQYATNTRGRPLTSVWMNGLCAFINAALCFGLLPWWGMLGGAVASTGSYMISFFLYTLWYARVSGRSGPALWRIQRDDIAAYGHLVRWLWRKFW